MKRAILIHGWEAIPEEGWRPWLRDELVKKGFEVFMPAMPDTKHPKRDGWIGELAKTVGKPDKDTYLVGHSLGNITILRYLESLKPEDEIGGAVLVAGFSSDIGFEEIKSFLEKPVEWDKIKKHCNKFVAIHSDNDPHVPVKEGEIFRDKLGAELIIKHNLGHLGIDDNITELPEVLESLLKFSD